MELQTSTSYSGKIISFGLKDFLQLIKHRLTSTVVFSAGIGFILGSQGNFLWNEFFLVLTSGFFITAGANIANQVIEKDTDKLMSRTKNRPLVTGRVQPWAASILSILFGAIGVSLLALFTNPLSAGIAFASFVAYAFIYTPMKRKSRISVLIGALPGAAPPIIGYTAAMGGLDELGLIIFLIQFVWQFPHFWAIAWNLDDDYKKAGIRMLPFKSGRSKNSALVTLLVTASLLFSGIYMMIFMDLNIISGALIVLLSLHFLNQAFNLFKNLDIKAAKKLMFGSFYYLPLVQLILIITKWVL